MNGQESIGQTTADTVTISRADYERLQLELMKLLVAAHDLQEELEAFSIPPGNDDE